MRSLIYLMLLVSTSLSAGTIHKWTDEDGNVFYGDRPPVSAETESVRVQSAPSNPTALPRLSSPSTTAAAGEDIPASDSNGDIPADQAKIACQNAQQDLEVIGRSARVKLKQADGNTRYLTTEEIEARRMQAEDDIKRFCQ